MGKTLNGIFSQCSEVCSLQTAETIENKEKSKENEDI